VTIFHRQMSTHYQNVLHFMRKALQAPTAGPPALPDADTRLLRAKLIFEEAMETINGLGVQIVFGEHDCAASGPVTGESQGAINFPAKGGREGRTASHRYVDVGDDHASLVEVVDGVCDCSVVGVGTLVACRVPDVAAIQMVDEHNLSKFGEGGYRRDDGKWIKPPGLRPPDIGDLLLKMESEWADYVTSSGFTK